ncbi:MAG: polyprenyl synthetase family protein [bacterium]
MKARIKSFILKIDKNLDKYLPASAYPEIIYKAMRYSIFAGGKRLRPILTLLTAETCGLSASAVMPVACAMEMIHTYSLIHDDLPAMDNDDYRRGKLTCHKQFGEATAILAGDALLTRAFELIFETSKNKTIKPYNIIKAGAEIAKAAGVRGMIGGQVVDMLSERKKISKETLTYLHTHKTGALISAAIVAGAVLADATPAERILFERFGNKIGLAFQIIDDILDVTANSKILGKTSGKDAAADKATYVKHYGLKASQHAAEKLILEAKVILGKIKRDTVGLESIADFFIKRTY